MVYASPAGFIHLLSPANNLGKRLLRLLFSAHALLPILVWSSGILNLHNALPAACLFVTLIAALSSPVFRIAK